jgi:sortase A
MSLTERRLGASLFLVVAVAFTGQGLWIYAKATLAQLLLRQAWAQTVNGARAVKPWPWADTWPVARLVVPRLGVDVIVLSGANGRTMAFGPGHVDGTRLPGEAGNSAITGHRDTHFRFLARLGTGDDIHLQTVDGSVRLYRVVSRNVVHESEMQVLDDDGESELTLITCFPFQAIAPGGPMRFVVLASAAGVEGKFRRRSASVATGNQPGGLPAI